MVFEDIYSPLVGSPCYCDASCFHVGNFVLLMNIGTHQLLEWRPSVIDLPDKRCFELLMNYRAFYN